MTENQLQYACIAFMHQFALPDVIYLHISNGGKQTAGQRIHKWKMGELPGYPDLQFIKDGKLYLVELKVGYRKLSDDQEAVKERLEAQGIPYAVIRTPEAFWEQVGDWGLLKPVTPISNDPIPGVLYQGSTFDD